jgi:type II secretory pathway component PulF
MPFAAIAVQRQPDPGCSSKAALILSPLYLVTILLIYASQSKHGEAWRARIESVSNFIPILGAARRFLALARLAAALEALISAGVNIVEAWEPGR